jgi:hypothetical protein
MMDKLDKAPVWQILRKARKWRNALEEIKEVARVSETTPEVDYYVKIATTALRED